MGRNTEIFVLDKDNASKNLYNYLKRNGSFKKYFGEGAPEDMDIDDLYERILSTVKKDINTISPDDLFEIKDYLDQELTSEEYDNSNLNWELRNKKVIDFFKTYGIISLFEIHTSTLCYGYMFLFGNFTDCFPLTENYDNGYNIPSTYFLTFNDFVILIMHRIIESNFYDGNIYPEEKLKVDAVIQEYKNNQIMNDCVNKEFDWLKSCMEGDDATYKAEKNTVYSAYLLLNQSLEMKSKINPQINPRIIISDSI